MRRSSRWFLGGLLLAATAIAATPPLFDAATESHWNVSDGKHSIGILTAISGASGTRAEWRATEKGAATTFIGGQGHVWLRGAGGDTDLATISASTPESSIAPALLLPFTMSSDGKVESKNGKPASYKYRGVKASYQYDARGPSKIVIAQAGSDWTLTRTSIAASHAAADTFNVRPKKTAASRLARLSGDLLGTSDSSVAATAGGRGAGHEGLKLNDGGDYEQVAKLERRDAAWRTKLTATLGEFQKDGKVGQERGKP